MSIIDSVLYSTPSFQLLSMNQLWTRSKFLFWIDRCAMCGWRIKSSTSLTGWSAPATQTEERTPVRWAWRVSGKCFTRWRRGKSFSFATDFANSYSALLPGWFRRASVVPGQARQGEMVRRRDCQLGHQVRSSKTARGLRLCAEVRAVDSKGNV